MDGTPKLPSAPGGKKKNSFLLGKEKFWGGLVALGATIVGGALLYKVLPYVLEILGNAITVFGQAIVLVGLGTFLAAFLYVVTHQRTRTLFKYWYAIMARKATKAMVSWAPADMLKAYSNEFLEKKLAIFRDRRQRVKASVANLTRTINNNVDARQEAWEEAQVLKRKSYVEGRGWKKPTDQNEFRLRSQKIDFLDKSNERLQAQLDRLEMLERILTKFETAFDYKIKEIQQWVQMFTNEYETLKDAAIAGQQAMDVVVGDDQKQVFDIAVEQMRDEMAQFQGQIEMALEVSGQLTSSYDIKSAAAEERVMAQLKALDSNADRLISDSQQKKAALQSRDARKIAGYMTERDSVVEPIEVRTKSKYRLRRGE